MKSYLRQPAQKAGSFYRPELDALRLFAFATVFLRHVNGDFGLARSKAAAAAVAPVATLAVTGAIAAANHPSHGLDAVKDFAQCLGFGVCLFFFLSSYLITKLLLLEKASTGTVAIRDFYLRRTLRIWPLFFFFIGICTVISVWLPEAGSPTPRVVALLFFVGNWFAVLHGWSGAPIEPLWSVCVEEQFYLIWPGFARSGKKAIVYVSIAFCIVSLLSLIYIGTRPGAVTTDMWPNSLVQCLFFSGGALAAVYEGGTPKSVPGVLLYLGSGVACWLVAAGVCHIGRVNSPDVLSLISGYYLVLVGVWLIFKSFLGLAAFPFPSWVLYLGKITYGLYVYHVLCLLITHKAMSALGVFHSSLVLYHLSSALVALLLTVAWAHLSYTFLEKPFLKLKNRFTLVRSRPE